MLEKEKKTLVEMRLEGMLKSFWEVERRCTEGEKNSRGLESCVGICRLRR